MPNNWSLMPLVLIVLLLLPIRLSSTQLKGLAFAIWLLGGLFMTWRGANFALAATEVPDLPIMIATLALALTIGWAKGKFVLSKTSQRNIARLEALTEPQKPIHVYSLRSWIMISVMVLIGVALNILNMPHFWRGAINLGIGMALIASSLAYTRALSCCSHASSTPKPE